MTKVDETIGFLLSLPPERGEGIATLLLELGADDDDNPYELTSEEAADIAASDAAASRGDFATDEQIRAIWAKHEP